VNFGIYTYVRYLNQKGLDDHYTNGLGQPVHIDQREDVELNKAKIEFRGWFLDPKFPLRALHLDQQRRAGAGRSGGGRRQPSVSASTMP